VFRVRYGLNSYILFRRNSVFKGLIFVLQDVIVHHHELYLREATGGDLHCLRHFRGGDT
jgi:hypothetical protein